MVTGASTADLALILVDARKGIIEQSRRHAFLASLLGVPHLVLCVNKMDLVDYDQAVFERIKAEFREFAAKLDVRDLAVHPDVGAERRQRRRPLREHAVVRGHVAAAPPRRGAHRLRPQPDRLPLPRAVRDPARATTSTTTTAATRARSRAAPTRSATTSWCCRRASRRRSRRSTPPTGRSKRPSRRCR